MIFSIIIDTILVLIFRPNICNRNYSQSRIWNVLSTLQSYPTVALSIELKLRGGNPSGIENRVPPYLISKVNISHRCPSLGHFPEGNKLLENWVNFFFTIEFKNG